ncbi:aquaporin-like protein [Leptotrombidium deliense]|uniref:Aquaporin-like protein n=1 Tax=Leptotrombidium deliense TaxID=299467 RepID=A0A443RSP9_9ACAR|nr:aquaporin-like protein [Leptotrombidium deliense]
MPNDKSSIGSCFIDPIVASSIFLIICNAIVDPKNMEVNKGIISVAIGFTNLSLILFAFGFNCMAPLNPARDFAPRLFTCMAGWGKEVFAIRNYSYFWIPIVAPHCGAIIGSWLYVIFVEIHWDNDHKPI